MRFFKITETDRGLEIEVHAEAEEKNQLLGEFQKCREGQCTCPTQEYEKLEAMDLEVMDQQINIHLVAKERMSIDQNEIARCLEHTTQKLLKGENEPGAL